jgi:hypothetical protein
VEVAVINRIVAIVSLAVTITSIARLLIVSNYQTPVAVAVAASNGTASTLTGTLVPLVPLFLPLVTQLLAICAFGAMLSGSKMRHPLFLAAAAAFTSTIFVAPTRLAIKDIFQSYSELLRNVGVLALTLVLLVSVVVSVIKPRVHAMEFITGSAFTVILVVIAVAVSTVTSYSFLSPSGMGHIPDVLRRVWLPAELIAMKDDPGRVGYVLKTDGIWATILWDSDRSIVIIRSQNIISRTLCRIGPPDGMPLISAQSAKVSKIEPCEFSVAGPVQISPLRVRRP